MKVIVVQQDGKELVLENCEQVRAIYDVEDVPGVETPCELHVVANEDFVVVYDLFTSVQSPLDTNIGSSADDVDDIVGRIGEELVADMGAPEACASCQAFLSDEEIKECHCRSCGHDWGVQE